MSNMRFGVDYTGMLPDSPSEGKLGYYPVSSSQEWKQLPDLYKVMTWENVPDFRNKNKPCGVKSVEFDVVYLEPYGIRAKVEVHPQEVQGILFTRHEETQCHLYTISSVELHSGTKIPVKWLQDSISGAFALVTDTARQYRVATQGGFRGHVPDFMERQEDGSFKYNSSEYGRAFGWGQNADIKTQRFAIGNPFWGDRNDRAAQNKQGVMTQEKFDAAKQCLVDNGIDASEVDAVLQALSYIVLDEETEQFMDNEHEVSGIAGLAAELDKVFETGVEPANQGADRDDVDR